MKKCLWCVLGLGALMLALIAVGVLPTAEASSGTKIDAIGQMGPYAIGFTSYVLTDNSRPAPGGYPAGGRPIPVYLWYPADPEAVTSAPRAEYPVDMLLGPPGLKFSSLEWEAMGGYDPAYQEPLASAKGPFPVLMVSHGMSVPAWFMTGIATRLASHGFVVAVPYHAGDAGWFDWQPAGDHLTLQLWNRPQDLSFVLTDLEQRNSAAGDLLYGVIDPSRVAASGWSGGGYAADVLAGGDDTVWDIGLTDAFAIYYGPIPDNVPHTPLLPDPRIKAIVTLDGANQMLRFEELARIKVPVLGLGEEWDAVAAWVPVYPGWQARPHAACSSHPNYRVDITGTNHYSFADFCNGLTVTAALGQTGPPWAPFQCVGVIPPNEARAIITRYMLAFLKTNLLGEAGYQPMLTPGWALTNETLVEFFETEKRNPNSIYEEWPDISNYFWHQPGKE